MALHDFRCQPCNHVFTDINVPIAIGGADVEIPCPTCGTRLQWIPQVGRMDAANGPSFVAFDTYDGKNQKVHVSSLKQLRDVERQSEIAHRNGEGQPMVFRRFSNDKSNNDKSALHPDWNGGERPTAEAKKKFGQTLQKTAEAPDTGYGPGVSDANASALPE